METTNTETTDGSNDVIFDRRLEAVKETIDLYHNYLHRYLYSLTNQWQDAENLLQDLWRYVLLRFKEDQIGSLPLLRKKAYQLFIDYYRRKVRRGEALTEAPLEPTTRAISREAYTEAEEIALKDRFWSEYPGICNPPRKEWS